jgi:hypothetical protein
VCTLIVIWDHSTIILFSVYGDHVFGIVTLPRVSLVPIIWYQSKMVRGQSLKIRGFHCSSDLARLQDKPNNKDRLYTYKEITEQRICPYGA